MTDKIKIAYIIDQLNIGGTEKQLLAIIEHLDRSLFEPYLVCLRPSASFDQCPVSCNRRVLELKSLVSVDGICKLLCFARYLRREKIDIVQTFFFDSTLFGILAAKMAGIKKTISCRRDMGFWYTPKLLFVLRFVNLMTDRILVNSQAIKRNVVIKEHVRLEKIDVVYNGIDLAPFSKNYDVVGLRSELGVPPTDKIVGIVANLNRDVKRVDIFIEVAAKILPEQVSFVIVGEGHLRAQLEQQAQALGVRNKIYFVGSQDNVIPWLQLMDIAMLTSESEGFSNSILEYMAAGLPVVCFDSGGNSEMVKDRINGSLVPRLNSQILAEELSFLLSDNAIIKTIGKRNTQDVRKFSWEYIVGQMNSIYLAK